MDKLDVISRDIGEIKVSVAIQNEQLKEHMRRTDLLETRVEQVATEALPVRDHVIFVQKLLKVVLALAGCDAVYSIGYKLWSHWH